MVARQDLSMCWTWTEDGGGWGQSCPRSLSTQPQGAQPEPTPVPSVVPLCISRLQLLCEAVGPEPLGCLGLPRGPREGTPFAFHGVLVQPDRACVSGLWLGWEWEFAHSPGADFRVVGFGALPAPHCNLGWREELRTDPHEKLCVSMVFLGVGTIQRGCLEELEHSH